MKEIREIIVYSDSEQKDNIERFINSIDCKNVFLLVTNKNLVISHKMTYLKRMSIENINFYHGLEEARKVVNPLYRLHFKGKSIFRDILTIDGYSILEIEEISFINNLLGPTLNKIS